MAKILLHSLVFSPDGVSTAYLMTDLARQLKKLGHEVTVLTTTPHYNLVKSAIEKQPLKPIWGKVLYKSECEGITVWHVRLPEKGEKVSGRTLDYLRFHLFSLIVGLTKLSNNYDIVLAPSPPLSIGVIAWLLAMMKKALPIYNVQEIYPDFAINQGILRNHFVIHLMKWLESFVYAKSAAVVPISEWFRRTIAERGVPDTKLFVISNFVDTELYQPMPRRNEFAEKFGLTTDFVVMYGGNVGLSQDWESFLYAATTLQHLPIRFVVVGDGVRKNWLEEEVQQRGLNNINILGYQPRDMMPLINASCDIATIPMKTTTTSDTFPSKIYTIMASGRPCLVSADEDSELAWLIHKSQSGRCVPPDEPNAYAEAVYQAYKDRALLQTEGSLGRKFVEKEYSKEAIAMKYDYLIQQLMSNGKSIANKKTSDQKTSCHPV